MLEFMLFTDLKFVQKQFLCCVPIKQINWKDALNDLSWEHQVVLLEMTVKNPLVLNYPIKLSYQQDFLKFVLKSFVKQCIDIHDEVYSIYCKLSMEDDSNWFYKHYVVDLDNSRKLLSIKENTKFISQGTVGLCGGQAALALSEWCISQQHLFHNKSVLELGSGTGLLGLAVWNFCKPRTLLLSDCHSNVLTILCDNIKENVETSGYKNCELLGDSDVNVGCLLKEKQSDDCRVVKLFNDSDNRELGIIDLPWEEVSISNVSTPDIILAADVVYDKTLLPSLCQALNYLIGWGKTDKYALIACTINNHLIIEEFLKISDDFKLRVCELDPIIPNAFLWCTETQISILKVSRD